MNCPNCGVELTAKTFPVSELFDEIRFWHHAEKLDDLCPDYIDAPLEPPAE